MMLSALLLIPLAGMLTVLALPKHAERTIQRIASLTTALTLGSRFSPAWLTRVVNKRIVGH